MHKSKAFWAIVLSTNLITLVAMFAYSLKVHGEAYDVGYNSAAERMILSAKQTAQLYCERGTSGEACAARIIKGMKQILCYVQTGGSDACNQ